MRTHLIRSLVLALGLVVAAPPIAFAAAVEDVQAAPMVVQVTGDRVTIRDKAATTGAVVATVVKGDQLDVLGTSGNWYRVRLRSSNREGFVEIRSVERVPARAATAAPAAPASTAPPAPAAAPAAGQTARPATPAPATPQTPRPGAPGARPTTPARKPPTPFHVRGILGMELFNAAAADTFKAIADASQFKGLTVGADVYGGPLPFNSFVRVGFSNYSLEGERVFIINNQAFGTGIPLTATMKPLQIGGGVRFPLKARPAPTTPTRPGTPAPAPPRTGPQTPPRPGQPAAAARRAPARPFITRLTPYAGATFVHLTYQEVSDLADDSENESESHNGFAVFGGLDVNIWKFVGAGVEAEFRQVKGFGQGGVSQALGDEQFGGFAIKFLVSISK